MFLYFIINCMLICYLLSKWKKNKSNTSELSSKLKNNIMCLPLVGQAYLLLRSDEERMKTFQRFGRIAIKSGGQTSIWLGHRFFMVVADPKSLEVIMKTCLDKDSVMDVAHDLLGNGVIFAPVPIWRPRRKVIAPTFSIKNLNQFVNVFSEQSLVMVDQLKAVAGKGTFSLWNYLTTYTMDAVCETTLGLKVDAQRYPNQPFLDAFNEFCKMSAFRMCMPPIAQQIYKYLPIYKRCMKHVHCMWDFVDKIIQKKREIEKDTIRNHDNVDKKLKTFLELYIESSKSSSGFTNVELREETLVLLLAGTDTSAVGASFTCLLLARYPEIQDKVYAELQEVFGDSNRPFTADDFPRLKYLEAVIKESLRLYPPVPIILRKSKKDITLPNGLEVPKNTSFVINIWAVHRNPEYWNDDAEVFRPERFLEDKLKHPAAFMPFSYGPRSCLGYKYAMMSMQTSVGSLVRHYRLSSDCDLKEEPLRVKFNVMMKHVDNFELKLEARR